MGPKVSIVTPSYNQARFLEETMLSVLNQDYPNVEYIVVDGGSTDGSVDIIKKYEDRLAWWVSEEDQGQSDAVNKGFKHANGDIFNWVNSDDLLMPSAVRIAVDYLTSKPDLGVVYGDRIVIDCIGNTLDLAISPPYCRAAMPYHQRIPQETSFIRRHLWEKVSGLDESYDYGMDFDFFLKASRHAGFYHIPFVLGAFRVHAVSKSARYAGSLKNQAKEQLDEAVFRTLGRRRSRMKCKFYRRYSSARRTLEILGGFRRREHRRIVKMINSQNSSGDNTELVEGYSESGLQ